MASFTLIIHLTRDLHFSPYLQFHGGTLIITLLRISITCYIRFVFVRNEFITFLEIIALQGLKMNAFNLNILAILLYKYHLLGSKSYPCAAYVYFILKKQIFG
jgi:hypothetical protein